MDGEKSKTEPGPTDSTTNAVQIGNLEVTARLTEETGGAISGSLSTGGEIKRKSTATPMDGAKRAQKKRRR